MLTKYEADWFFDYGFSWQFFDVFMENGAKTLLKTAKSFDIVAAVDNILLAKYTQTIINGFLRDVKRFRYF